MKLMCRRVLIALLLTIISLAPLCSQAGDGKSFLWEVKTDSGSSYLLGSVHVLKKEHYPLNPAIEKAFDQTDILAVEVNIAGPKIMEVGMKMLQKAMYPGEETLEDNISKKTFGLLKEKLKALDMDYGSLKKMKPWMVAMTILQSELLKLGFNPKFGVDMYFLDKATKKKQEIVELEGAEFQLNLFDGFSKEESEKFLLSTILEADQIEKELDKMIEAWMKGDAEAMEELLTGSIDKYPELKEFYKKINDDRNVGMVKKITSYLASGKRYFVVVGAAHMVGEKGIVSMLQKKGYTVNQL
jgi:uncharacterized protein YbaP (TraB family)